MRKLIIGSCVLVGSIFAGSLLAAVAPANAAPCPGNPDALGTSRTLTVDAAAFPRIGTMQYKTTLPLNDHEVVLTFDDGPLPPYTDRVLATLASQCVKATFFIVGTMARAYPDTVRRVYNAGHTIGTHSQRHPFNLGGLGLARIQSEVDGGIASVQKAVGDPRAVAPFFRIPGLARSRQAESYLASQSLAVWSADEVADDWFKGITPAQIVRKAIGRIEAKGHRGVLLLHDIHPATAMALPTLLKELKAKGYRIVQAVPAGDRPDSVPERPAPTVAAKGGWPRLTKVSATATTQRKHKRIAKAARDEKLAAAVAEKKSKTHTALFDFSAIFRAQ
ncbi:MAG: polysaccharide deacetylase family protein [Pseudolabrys sp.]|nr:polysaccharide deacetylase family protein [Pseudolabrys sp.]